MIEGLFEQELPIDPLQEDLADQLSTLPTCKGILLLADENSRPIQLLIAANIRRTAFARLRQTDQQIPPKKADLVDVTRCIFYLSCHNSFRSSLNHLRTARQLWPNRYLDQVTLPRQSFIHIDPSAAWPVFTISSKPFSEEQEKGFGLFPNRKAADELTQVLLDTFMLCKRPDLADSPEKAKSCPYLQMDTCPAPCIGRISREKYLSQINTAIQVLSDQRADVVAEMNQQMQQYARQMDFEKAQNLKIRMEQLRILDRPAYTWTTDLSQLILLHIDRSARIKIEGKRTRQQSWAAFVIRPGRIDELTDFFMEDLESARQKIQAITNEKKEMDSSRQAVEELAVASYHLFRSNPEGIWINITNKFPSTDQLRQQIEERYNQKESKHAECNKKGTSVKTDVPSQ
ncbi:MAG: UvrB/UvrC motif-containing protein [Sedimentisphaerales bacterium]|nr:UvrB/UvrC motif-containing protein [Sedimentisphaerales bacterium]